MYVVTEDGQKLPVDCSSLSNDDYIPFCQTVGLYTSDTILRDVWILYLEKQVNLMVSFETELVKELKYDHEPTKEEILGAMSQYGLSRWDIATVQKGYELDVGE